MKLLIELDEEYIKVIDKINFLVGGRTDRKLQLEIIKAIKNGKPLEQEPILDKYQAEIDHLHKYIARLETQITDSFINKSCVSEKVCEHDKNVVIDKIRAEIEQTVSRYSISRERVGMGQVEWSDFLIKESEVLKILDKYKADSVG